MPEGPFFPIDKELDLRTTRSAATAEQTASAWPAHDLPTLDDRAASSAAVVGDRDEYARHVEESVRRAAAEGRIRLPDLVQAGVVSLAQWQTPIRNQGGRGTCYAFAAVAAMEAAYKRAHGVELDLSEQVAFHLNKAGELFANFESTPAIMHENNSSVWGFQGSSDIADKLVRSAIPLESDAPYLSAEQMESLRTTYGVTPEAAGSLSQETMDGLEFAEGHVPLAARQAARYRIGSTAALPGMPSVQQIQTVISAGHEVIADVPGHCVLIVGFDTGRREWLIKNSWGEAGLIRSSFDSTSWPILGGRYITSIGAPDALASPESCWLGRWQVDHDGWRGELVVRRTTDYRQPAGQATKLGSYYRDGNRYDVNGRCEDNGRQLHFWVADTTDRVPAGQQRGQELQAWLFSWEPTMAAGLTSWSGQPYGVSMSRSTRLPGAQGQGFEPAHWVGRWAMDHDGWKGMLEVTSIEPLSATYTPEGGTAVPVSGTVAPSRSYELDISIQFANHAQPFRLLGHTWENDTFSGTTMWADQTFGAHGVRQARKFGRITEKIGRGVHLGAAGSG